MQVLVAMSGGVDSSAAAALLLEQGHEVVGVTMKLWGGASDTGCCSVADVEDARRVAQQLGIDHVVTPRACLANRVLKLVHQDALQSIAVLEEGQVEIVEFAVDGEAPIIGKTLQEVFDPRRGYRGALVGAIIRGEDVIVPRGSDKIQAGDSIIMIAAPDALDGALKLFIRR